MGEKLNTIADHMCEAFDMKRSINGASFIEIWGKLDTSGVYSGAILMDLINEGGKISIRTLGVFEKIPSNKHTEEIVEIFIKSVMEIDIYKELFEQASIKNRGNKLKYLIG